MAELLIFLAILIIIALGLGFHTLGRRGPEVLPPHQEACERKHFRYEHLKGD